MQRPPEALTAFHDYYDGHMGGTSDYRPIRKKPGWWLVGAIGIWLLPVLYFLVLGTLITTIGAGLPPFFWCAALLFPAIISGGLFLVLLLGSKIFPWRYSFIGPYERTPAPKGFQAHITMDVTPARPQYVIRYEVGQDGIELTFGTGSRAFLPASFITGIGPGDFHEYLVEHDFPEICSPLVVSKAVGEVLLANLHSKEPGP